MTAADDAPTLHDTAKEVLSACASAQRAAASASERSAHGDRRGTLAADDRVAHALRRALTARDRFSDRADADDPAVERLAPMVLASYSAALQAAATSRMAAAAVSDPERVRCFSVSAVGEVIAIPDDGQQAAPGADVEPWLRARALGIEARESEMITERARVRVTDRRHGSVREACGVIAQALADELDGGQGTPRRVFYDAGRVTLTFTIVAESGARAARWARQVADAALDSSDLLLGAPDVSISAD